MSKELQIRDAIENAEANVEFLATMPDYKLAEKLDSVHLQMALAEKKKNTPALELLEVWRKQIIDARIYKAENNIPNAPNEIELAIADIETVVTKIDQRNEILSEYNNPIKQSRPKVQSQQDNDSQLSLF
ncbi:MAG: hypothetical protein K8R85_05905 [Bacteroidetes bacterium]|nr:hypothetical protein [Bacteroidota bacterium]